MALVGAELGAGGAMRRVRTPIMHGQMHTVANAIGERGNIQLPYFVFDPSSVCAALWLGYLNLTRHHLCCIRLLLFHTVRIVLSFEAAQIHLDISLGHGKAAMPKKLFDRVHVHALLNHICGERVPKLMRRDDVRMTFILEG